MDTQSAADKLHRLQIESEMIQVKAAIDGIKRGDLYVFYTDRSGAGQVLFLGQFATFSVFYWNGNMRIIERRN